MKKILTLLFFAGFLTTAAFAQDGGRHRQNDNQYNDQYNNGRNSSYGDHGNRNIYGNDYQWQNRGGDEGYRRQRDDRHRRDRWNRDGDRGYNRNYRDYDDDRGIVTYPYGYSRPAASFQIIIGRHGRH